MSECRICPRNCGVDRVNGTVGYCKAPEAFRIGRIAPHYWEEPVISGEKGSGAVFFAGCNMGCVYCQNEVLSHGRAGREYSDEAFLQECLRLQEEGCHNLNLVTPSHYAHRLADFLPKAKAEGLRLPVVYNTSSYENAETLRRLKGLVDVYLPDFKYLSPQLAKKYSHAENYPEIAKKALEEMVRQQPSPVFQGDLMKKGVLVRHLVLPGYVKESKEVIRFLYETYGNAIYISIMNQYTPMKQLADYPELNRTLTEKEYDEVVNFAISIGVEQGFIQEGETCKESFIPEFYEENRISE